MSKEKTFIDGMWVEDKETQYGIFQKITIKVENFKKFMDEHATINSVGDLQLKIDLMTAKSGKKFAYLNTYKADTSANSYGEEKYEKPKKLEPATPEQFEEDDIPF